MTITLYHKRLNQLAIRIIAIILLYLLIINFSLRINVRGSTSVPVLLVDCSPSMNNFVQEVYGIVDSLHFNCQKLFFSDTVYNDKNAPDRRLTNITNALITAQSLVPSSIILVSDGNHNLGPSPVEIREKLKVPVYCFGAGNKRMKDQAIVNVFYPEYAFRNDTVVVEAIVETNGMTAKTGRISLKSSSMNIERDFRLTESLTRHSIEFKFIPAKTGEEKYKISLAPQPEEVNYVNNESFFSISTYERKIPVLYYTDCPSFNTSFILNCLERNVNFELSQAVRISENRFKTTGELANHEKLDYTPFEIIVIDNINTGENLLDIKEFLKKSKGILFIGAIRGTTQILNEILPFRTNGTQFEKQLQMKILSPFSVLSPAEDYAPVSNVNRIIGINPDTKLIAQAEEIPLIGYRITNGGIVFQINIVNLGVWHYAQLNLNHRDILNPLLDEITKLLSPYGRNERLLLRSPKHQYHIGEKISFYLKSYDRDMMPGSGGDFYLDFAGKNIPFFEIRKGIYEATLYAETSGEFMAFARGNLQNDTLESNPLKIAVAEISSEPEELINEALLEEIALKTNGGYYELSKLKQFQPPRAQEYHETKLLSFDHPFLYVIIFGLLVIDWIIRKKGGLI
ncbi:MAG: hypothetical protein ABIL22_03430 [candidate division WOR-3 bacterium]